MTGQNNSGILQGAAWVGSSRMVVRLLGLCSTLVLARLLVPEDFGLVAIATGVIGLLGSFTELGFNQALIRFQDVDDDDYATAWTLNVCRGVLLCLVVLGLAYPVSVLLDDGRLVALFAVISITPLIGGLENPRWIIFEKKLEFNVFFRLMVITKVSGVMTTITLALLWRSYWVLVIGMLVTHVTRTFLTYYYTTFTFKLTISSWRKLIGFSGWLAGANVLQSLGNRLDPLILAAFATTHIVGVLHIARELTYMTFSEVAIPMRRVLFPALSKCSSSFSEFQYSYQQAVSGLFMLLAPICFGVILTIPDAVPLIMGEKWVETIIPIQFIAFALALSIIGQLSHSAAMAKGRPQLVFQENLIVTPFKLVLYVLGVKYYGLYGAVFASCFELVLSTIIRLYISVKMTQISIIKHFFLVKRYILSLSLMCVLVYVTSLSIFPGQTGTMVHMIRLAAMISVGIIAYSGFTILFWIMLGKPSGPEATIMSYLKYYTK